MNKPIQTLVFFLFVFSVPTVHTLQSQDSVHAAPLTSLKASTFHEFLFGTEWRNLWILPIDAPLLKSGMYDGGITFVRKESLTHQNATTLSLVFKDSSEREYHFTPFNQDSAYALPPELCDILPRDVVNDQRGSLNPYASLIVSSVLQKVGLPYRSAELFILPNDTCLDEYQIPAASRLGILEGPVEFPKQDHPSSTIDTRQLLDHLNGENHERVDEIEYLKVRLVDILIGDWDRTPEQLRWYATKSNNFILWKPISLNHEKALVRYDGILPTIADLAVPQMEHCGEGFPNIENLTWNARALDRRFLISHIKQTWDSLAKWIQQCLKDSVLECIVTELPKNVIEQEGDDFLQLLKGRRDLLPKVAEEFYRLSSAYIDIYGSDKAERVEVRRTGRHIISVVMYDRFDSSSSPALLYQRLFHDDYTREIRLILQGGDDRVIIEGEQNSTINLIVDGGEGQNELIDKTKGRSVFTTINPLATGKVIFYDSNPNSRIVTSSTTKVVRDVQQNTSDNVAQPIVAQRDWGNEWTFTPWLDINPDDGLLIGGGPVFTQYGYRIQTYDYRFTTRAGWATRTGHYCVEASGEFRDWISGAEVLFHLHASQLDFSNFFGLGNETSFNEAQDKKGFYRVNQPQIHIGTKFNFISLNAFSLSLDGTLKIVDNNPRRGTLLDSTSLPYSHSTTTSAALTGQLQYDTRNNISNPTSGTCIETEVALMPRFIDLQSTFTKVQMDVRTFLTLDPHRSLILALRLNGGKIWGNHPFFESLFLGGNTSLRGFERQRFAGDAAILGSAEIRAQLAQIPFLVPLWIGISTFCETGRVFLEGETSNRLHTVVGGGVWSSFIKHEYIVNLTLARSEDEFAFYATLGFMF